MQGPSDRVYFSLDVTAPSLCPHYSTGDVEHVENLVAVAMNYQTLFSLRRIGIAAYVPPSIPESSHLNTLMLQLKYAIFRVPSQKICAQFYIAREI